MKNALFALLLLLAATTMNAQTILKGDMNNDGKLTIADVTMLVDLILKDDGHDYVDLGLPSHTLWATCNVGASSPEEYGDYFAWGETSAKDTYNWDNYKWSNGSMTTLTKYCNNSDFGYNGLTDGKTVLDPEDDAAYVNWGPAWCMPTKEQLEELLTECNWTMATMNYVGGYEVKSKTNTNSIFLPLAGYRSVSSLVDLASYGYYWSRTLFEDGPRYAWYMGFGSGGIGTDDYYRCFGYSVRPVRAQ